MCPKAPGFTSPGVHTLGSYWLIGNVFSYALLYLYQLSTGIIKSSGFSNAPNSVLPWGFFLAILWLEVFFFFSSSLCKAWRKCHHIQRLFKSLCLMAGSKLSTFLPTTLSSLFFWNFEIIFVWLFFVCVHIHILEIPSSRAMVLNLWLWHLWESKTLSEGSPKVIGKRRCLHHDS